MGLSSIFKRTPLEPESRAAAVNEPVDEVQRARLRARQRLIGAVVLLAIGVIGFPLVFETQPRPIPVDIPIEIPRKEGVPPLVVPRSDGAPALAAAPDAPLPQSGPEEVITESRDEAPRAAPAPDAARPPELAASRATAKAATRPAAELRAEAKPEAADDGARARALLEGKTPAAAEAARFIVQIGAFADANAAHDTRVKVEKLGMKTYTQVASTPAGNRIRVRVGPFVSRDEADRAMSKARGAGLSAVVLTL